ncbi:hypothetical protein [Nonomuraea sp. NPDC049480]|uniref:hypothetical protein n=1 Tax=Nonomuraea sp. NPDC049480 TaxID=3364353 RepID=UPI0037BAC6B1
MRADATSALRRLAAGRLWAIAGLTAALLPLGGVAAAASSSSAPAPAVICVPQAPVCYGIRGTVGAYHYWFWIQPPPTSAVFSFTVNGAPVSGTVSRRTVGGALEGEFRPTSPLTSGDRVCMRYAGGAGPYCATTP